MAWKDKLDQSIKSHLEKQISKTVKDRDAYNKAPNPGNAQLWVAIANLSKELFDLNLKLDYLKKALINIGKEKPKATKKGKK